MDAQRLSTDLHQQYKWVTVVSCIYCWQTRSFSSIDIPKVLQCVKMCWLKAVSDWYRTRNVLQSLTGIISLKLHVGTPLYCCIQEIFDGNSLPKQLNRSPNSRRNSSVRVFGKAPQQNCPHGFGLGEKSSRLGMINVPTPSEPSFSSVRLLRPMCVLNKALPTIWCSNKALLPFSR